MFGMSSYDLTKERAVFLCEAGAGGRWEGGTHSTHAAMAQEYATVSRSIPSVSISCSRESASRHRPPLLIAANVALYHTSSERSTPGMLSSCNGVPARSCLAHGAGGGRRRAASTASRRRSRVAFQSPARASSDSLLVVALCNHRSSRDGIGRAEFDCAVFRAVGVSPVLWRFGSGDGYSSWGARPEGLMRVGRAAKDLQHVKLHQGGNPRIRRLGRLAVCPVAIAVPLASMRAAVNVNRNCQLLPSRVFKLSGKLERTRPVLFLAVAPRVGTLERPAPRPLPLFKH